MPVYLVVNLQLQTIFRLRHAPLLAPYRHHRPRWKRSTLNLFHWVKPPIVTPRVFVCPHASVVPRLTARITNDPTHFLSHDHIIKLVRPPRLHQAGRNNLPWWNWNRQYREGSQGQTKYGKCIELDCKVEAARWATDQEWKFKPLGMHLVNFEIISMVELQWLLPLLSFGCPDCNQPREDRLVGTWLYVYHDSDLPRQNDIRNAGLPGS